MLCMDCDHPDIEEFINVKSDLDRVTKANISVKIKDELMEAVKEDKDYSLQFYRPETDSFIKKTVKAKELLHQIAKMNWDYAEPGALFWDRIENWNLQSNTPEFKLEATNPCGELPLPAGGSCLLGSINLAEFVRDAFTDTAYFDYESFIKAVKIAVRGLNEVLEEGIELHPLEEQRKSVSDWLQIGLGVFGIADMLIKLGVEYGSEQSLEICNVIGKYMIDFAVLESAMIAKEKGTYKYCKPDQIMSTEFFNANCHVFTREAVEKYGIRNSQLLTIAPTGTLSTMLGVSGGIEPIFANSYNRKTESLHGEDHTYKVYTKIVQDYIDKYGIKDESELPSYFVTANDIHYKDRLKMQAVWQKHIDNSISSTVNVPEDFTVEQVEDLYMKAWELGLKGVTIYRANCKRSGILTADSDSKDDGNKRYMTYDELPRGAIVNVSDDVIGLKRKLTTGCGTLHCSAFFDPVTGDLLETYLSKGSTGGCNNSLTGLSRLSSVAARGGVSIYDIVDQLESTGVCPSYAVRKAIKNDTSKGSCCPVAVANALLDMYNDVQSQLNCDIEEEISPQPKKPQKEEISKKSVPCPECGESLIFEGGCNVCKACGWSKCS